MRDSVIYQAIMAEGMVRARHEDILRMGGKKFGVAPTEANRAAVMAVDAPERLAALLVRLLVASSWDELLPPPEGRQTTDALLDPITLLRPRRKVTGVSAILLPFTADGAVDWDSFAAHVVRTADAGLTPAVNMDTGYVNLLDDAQRYEVLLRTRAVLGGRPFVAGAFVGDQPGDSFNRDVYCRQFDLIQLLGGVPVVFQSYGLMSLPDDRLIDAYADLGKHCDRFIAFELGSMFAPFGKIYSLDVYRGLLGVPQCIGAKHSSLQRDPEWRRLMLRDRVRPDFRVYTGNDLAIDMVMYGSDYLLGLSTFAPDLFARRDALWEAGDPAFHELNDVLQYLGFLAFRPPVPAYKHSAAMFLHLRGWTRTDAAHPQSPTRPSSDRPILREIGRRLGVPMTDEPPVTPAADRR